MTLNQLKTALLSVPGSDIKDVLFDFQEFLNDAHKKVYPTVIWTINGGQFKKDIRPGSFSPKELTLSVFILQGIDEKIDDNLTVWDDLEPMLDAYLLRVNELTKVKVLSINSVDGTYYPEGLIDVDSEVGIGYKLTIAVY